jgi:hypothetical protein
VLKIIRHAVLILLLSSQWLPAQVFNPGLVGYYSRVFFAGDNLFVVPFQIGSGNNLLSSIFLDNSMPNGTSISFWSPSTASFATNVIYQSGVWSEDVKFTPGTAARLNVVTTFTNAFAGTVLNHDGTIFTVSDTLTPPPLFTGQDGVYLFGDATPITDIGIDVFLNIIGRAPNIGEQVTLLDGLTQTYTTSTYLGSDSWDVVPVLNVTQAAFFNLITVPEPSITVLGALGLSALAFLSRRPR